MAVCFNEPATSLIGPPLTSPVYVRSCVHVGQTLPTRIIRFITPDSIEGAVLQLQASKPSSGLSLLNAVAAADGGGGSASGGKKAPSTKGKAAGGTEALAAEVEFQDMLKVVRTMLAEGRGGAEK